MAAEQTVERLRRMMHEDEVDGLAHSLLPRADVRAVLAVVEAAQELEGQPLNYVRHSSLRRLSKALELLHTQASDEGADPGGR